MQPHKTWEQAATSTIGEHTLWAYEELRDLSPEQFYDYHDFRSLARWAWRELHRADVFWETEDQVELLSRKQRDYGHDNVNKFGALGVEVRLWDKIARYQNLLGRGSQAANESTVDTLKDVIGYVTIWYMVKYGVFNLPLEEDL